MHRLVRNNEQTSEICLITFEIKEKYMHQNIYTVISVGLHQVTMYYNVHLHKLVRTQSITHTHMGNKNNVATPKFSVTLDEML